MYHQPFKCRVTGSKSNTPLATPKPPVWCEGNPGGCTKGAKQMVYWNQNSGNNVHVTGWDLNGDQKAPSYNSKMGFSDGESFPFLFFFFLRVRPVDSIKSATMFLGAQNDIFAGPPSSGSPRPSGGSSNTGSGSSGSSGGSGNSLAANPKAPTSSPASTPSSAPGAPASGNGLTTSPIPNKAPSCKKRRRSVALEDNTLVRKSSIAGGSSHRRHARRNWWYVPHFHYDDYVSWYIYTRNWLPPLSGLVQEAWSPPATPLPVFHRFSLAFALSSFSCWVYLFATCSCWLRKLPKYLYPNYLLYCRFTCRSAIIHMPSARFSRPCMYRLRSSPIGFSMLGIVLLLLITPGWDYLDSKYRN